MNWKLVGLGALVNAIITVLLIMIYLPLSFVGPVIGGFLASFFTRGYKNYGTMDLKDGAVVGAISGLIGGLIMTSLLIWFGSLNTTIGGIVGGNVFLLAYVILQITTVASFILGLLGGVVGVAIKN